MNDVKKAMAVKGNVRMFCCGGLGINLGKSYIGTKTGEGFANILPAFIDTSRSNLGPDVPEELTYILENTDGSGKVRKENYSQINAAVKQIVLQQRPEDFNIVVFSSSGGSGSVIGPLLVSELLERGHSVVVVTAGSSESTITANNTNNTLKSLAAIAKKIDVPIVTFYRHNGGKNTRSVVDSQLHFAISCLCYLASRQNDELDTKDVSNWLRYNNSTGIPAQLSFLDIYTDQDSITEIKDPISIASLYSDKDQPHLEAPIPEYACVGYLETQVKDITEMHLVVSTEHLDSIYTTINKTLMDYIDRLDSRVVTRDINAGAAVPDDGMFL